MYDLIGDLHGHADELTALLERLGYARSRGVYRHPKRQVIFVGDFIDRGPRIRETLEIVRPMVEEGAALAVMGNHELNALAFHTPDRDRPGEYLRSHSEKNVHQHAQTMRQLNERELATALAWFRTLPLWLDLPGLRAIHACWDERCTAVVAAGLNEHGGVTDSFLHSACREGEQLFHPTEVLLKGKEVELPPGISYRDGDGCERTSARVRWYLPATEMLKFDEYIFRTQDVACPDSLPPHIVAAAEPYPPDAKPVFVGHYWLRADRPTFWADNVACLDYSVAKGGMLCAYRWSGERKLSALNFVSVAAV